MNRRFVLIFCLVALVGADEYYINVPAGAVTCKDVVPAVCLLERLSALPNVTMWDMHTITTPNATEVLRVLPPGSQVTYHWEVRRFLEMIHQGYPVVYAADATNVYPHFDLLACWWSNPFAFEGWSMVAQRPCDMAIYENLIKRWRRDDTIYLSVVA